VVQRDRKLSIAADRCWVDALELETRLDAALARLERWPACLEVDHADGERVARLYRGPLLAGSDAPWAAAARARVRRKLSRWLEAVERVSRDRDHARALRASLAAADPGLYGEVAG
jgi:hypothetical protein